MSLIRFDLMVPENFKYGMEVGVIAASQFHEGVEKGIRHFSAETKKEIHSVEEILEEVNKNECIVVWHEELTKDFLGLTVFSEDGRAMGHKLPMHPEIAKLLFKEGEQC